jgi:high-affinity Fe2+/Pb2+ permease
MVLIKILNNKTTNKWRGVSFSIYINSELSAFFNIFKLFFSTIHFYKGLICNIQREYGCYTLITIFILIYKFILFIF